MDVRLQKLIENVADHEHAAEEILLLGASAVPALADFLAGPTQPSPQARLFAVCMLDAIGTPAALAALDRSVRAHSLQSLHPQYAQAEYVVKNEALRRLARRRYLPLDELVSFALLEERLPAAAAAAAERGIQSLIPELAGALGDDMLGSAAFEALVRFGAQAVPALAIALAEPASAAFGQATHRRLMTAIALATIGAPDAVPALQRLRHDPHPLLRSTAASGLTRLRAGAPLPAETHALVRGALCPAGRLRLECQAAVEKYPGACLDAMLSELRCEWTIDLYRDRLPVGPAERAWLLRVLFLNTDAPRRNVLRATVRELPASVTIRALRGVRDTTAVPNIIGLIRHPDPGVRTTLAGILGELRTPVALDTLIDLALEDPHRRVRGAALKSLHRLLQREKEAVSIERPPLHRAWGHPFTFLRLRQMLRAARPR